MMVISDYNVVEEIARNSFYVLFRAQRNKDGKSVLLKTASTDLPTSASQENLRREFGIFGNLEIKGVARVIELVEDNCLVLEDIGGNLLREFCGSNQPNLETFFKLAVELTTVLSEIHRREIVLNNINPDNILFNPETGEVCFLDFGCAARRASENQVFWKPNLTNSDLRYQSPEQTGRMNRAIDYRTDFYSLGVVLYELLTGNPPFDSGDPLELIHSHLARPPLSPSEINLQIPETVSEIVLKLLTKTADERYQNALGLKADLEICADEWARKHRITPFVLGSDDVSGKFSLPQNLYGREPDVRKLLSVFELVSEGAPALMLVAGYSGIGKTSLIQEIHKPIVLKNGYFISGKFDQVARGTPFNALIQAFRGLVRQLLTESDEQLDYWRRILTEALGANGGVLVEVIPEIELIIGEQEQPPLLGATETLNRFNSFSKTLSVRSPEKNIRWLFFLTICNGLIRRR